MVLPSRQRGFLLITVLVTLFVVAALGLLVMTEGGADADRTARATEALQADYAVLAALEHAAWKADQGSCSSYALPATSFGNHNYSASYSATAGSPINITATATLATGTTRTRSRSQEVAHQAPNTAILQPGAAAGADVFLDSANPTRNSGGTNNLRISADPGARMNALLRFDLASIPYGAQVVSARLELRMWSLQAAGTAVARNVSRAWVEGTNSGGGTANGATWNTYDATSPWTTAGGDLGSEIVSRTTINTGDAWVAFDIAPLAQAWLNGAPNYGVALVGEGALRSAEFASRETSGAADRPKLTITYACECGVACAVPNGTGNLLFVVDSSSAPTAADIVKSAVFGSWGYTVTMIAAAAGQNGFDTTLALNDVVYVSSSTADASLANKLLNASKGVVSEQGLQNDNLGISTSASWTTGDTLTVADNTHYITQPFATGSLRIYDAAMEATRISGTAAPGLASLGTWSGTPSLAVLEAGALSSSGGVAAGRRALVPLGRNLDWRYLNNNGRLLVQRALEWGKGTGGGCPSTTPLLFVVSNPTAPTSQEAARKNILESWCYAVALIDDAATQTEYDSAVNAAKVVYVSSEAVASQIGTKLKAKTIGIVNEDPQLHTVFGFSTNRYQGSTNAPLKPIGTHYITAPLAGGAITLFTSNQPAGGAVGTLPAGLVSIGAWSSGTLSPLGGLLTLDAGVAIAGGGTAAGRRVQMPWDGVEGGAVANIGALTADGLTILQRSLTWAAGLEPLAGPIAHWKLDDGTGFTAVDSEGGHDGKLVGGTWTTGTLGGALDFNGSTDYVLVADDPNLDITKAITLMAWIKPNKVAIQYFLKKAISGSTDGYELVLSSSGKVVFRLNQKSQGDTYRIDSATSYPTDGSTWMHAAATYDGTVQRLYINGIEEVSNPASITIGTNDTALGIGAQADGIRLYDGTMDDVRIYNRALSPTEITAAAGKGGGGGGGGGSCAATFADDFASGGYTGSTGTGSWATSWLEINESDGPSSGDEQVVSGRARVQDNDGGGEGLQREVNLSAYTSATLRVTYERSGLDDANDYATLDISSDGGKSWTELDRFAGPANFSSPQLSAHNITSYISPNTRIRMLTSSSMGNTDLVYFDDVVIEASNCPK